MFICWKWRSQKHTDINSVAGQLGWSHLWLNICQFISDIIIIYKGRAINKLQNDFILLIFDGAPSVAEE